EVGGGGASGGPRRAGVRRVRATDEQNGGFTWSGASGEERRGWSRTRWFGDQVFLEEQPRDGVQQSVVGNEHHLIDQSQNCLHVRIRGPSAGQAVGYGVGRCRDDLACFPRQIVRRSIFCLNTDD